MRRESGRWALPRIETGVQMNPGDRVSGRPISLLIAAAICSLMLSGGAGLLVFQSTQHLVQASDRVARAQEALTNLQTTSQSIDRIEAATRFYLLTHDEADARAIQQATLRLETNLVHFKTLISNDPAQSADINNLLAGAEGLTTASESAADIKVAPNATLIFNCRQTAARMQERERTLLQKFSQQFQNASIVTLTTGSASAALAASISVILFAFLVRDARHSRQVSDQIMDANQRLADTVLTLERRVEVSRLLSSARDELQLCIAAPDAYASTARFVARLMPGASGALCIINNSRQTVERVSHWGGDQRVLESFPLDACCGLRSGHLRWRSGGLAEVHCTHFAGTPPENYICIPMAALGDTLGVLYVDSPKVTTTLELEPLRELIELTAMALANLQLRQRLENQSIRDSLTSLFNRNFMEIALGRELRRAARHQSTLALFMLDVDHFKNFNDSFGHEAGDTALREIASVLSSSIRSEDVACRYGGEEFVIILPEIQPGTAAERAESIRRAISEIRFDFGDEVPRQVTISIGIAVYPENGETAETLLRAADRNLYRAKRLGRNQVIVPEFLSRS